MYVVMKHVAACCGEGAWIAIVGRVCFGNTPPVPTSEAQGDLGQKLAEFPHAVLAS